MSGQHSLPRKSPKHFQRRFLTRILRVLASIARALLDRRTRKDAAAPEANEQVLVLVLTRLMVQAAIPAGQAQDGQAKGHAVAVRLGLRVQVDQLARHARKAQLDQLECLGQVVSKASGPSGVPVDNVLRASTQRFVAQTPARLYEVVIASSRVFQLRVAHLILTGNLTTPLRASKSPSASVVDSSSTGSASASSSELS